MTPQAAAVKADELNKTGRHREEWYYYPTRHSYDEWFVARRHKSIYIWVAVFVNGELSITEEYDENKGYTKES